MSVTPDQVRAQLDRILASPGLAGADRASRFLRYVVERALAGEGDQLKEYVVGRDVFDRGDDYDPRIDSIVRVEAGRLRSKIDEYYSGPGRSDVVGIQLRRGSYAPIFETRKVDTAPAETRSASSRWRIGLALMAGSVVVLLLVGWRAGIWATVERQPPTRSIAVLPFANYSTDPAERLLAARVTDGVTSELARLGTLGVVSHTSALQYAGVRQPIREIATALNAQFILEGNVRDQAGEVLVQVRLVDASVDRKFWVKDFHGALSDIPDIQRRIASAAATAIVQR